MRVGLGIDTHQLVPGKSIRLGGVDIPSNVSIKAHSDGDIIYHAVADSILGAIGGGDIGDHFPDTDPNNKDLDSAVIVNLAINKALLMNLILNNLDITLMLDSPKISQYKVKMTANLVEIFSSAYYEHYMKLIKRTQSPSNEEEQVKILTNYITDNMFNIKASTSESLGFIGKGQGVTCYCIASFKDL